MKRSCKESLVLAVLAGACTFAAAGTLEQIAWNNSSWCVTTLDTADYVALSGDGGTADCVYAALKDGGIIQYYFDGSSWTTRTVVTGTVFGALTRDASRANIVFGAPTTGGLIQYEWNGSSWAANVVDGETSRVYIALTHDTAHQNKVYGAPAAGGIYEITYTGSGPYGGWAADQRIASDFVYQQLTIHGGLSTPGAPIAGMFGLTKDGYIEQIGWPINGIWDHTRLDSDNTYTAITGENSQPALYAARTGGGLYQSWYGTLYPVDTTRIYGALADSTGSGNSFLGIVGKDVYEIGHNGSWQSTYRCTGQNYGILTPDGVRGAAVYGVVLGRVRL